MAARRLLSESAGSAIQLVITTELAEQKQQRAVRALATGQFGCQH